jgi:spore coat polysaccharide biosynthesis protein SpsF (cytidylyltransferase family)
MQDKVLLPFCGEESILRLLIRSLKQDNRNKKIIMVTSDLPEDAPIVDLMQRTHIPYHRGSAENVLKSFIEVAEEHELDRIVRVYADTPFLRADAIDLLFAAHNAKPCDYIGYSFADGTPVAESNMGLFGELTTRSALKEVAKLTKDKRYTVQMTNFLYTFPALFTSWMLPLPPDLKENKQLSFTPQTPEEFTLLQELYTRFHRREDQSLDALLHLVKQQAKFRKRLMYTV